MLNRIKVIRKGLVFLFHHIRFGYKVWGSIKGKAERKLGSLSVNSGTLGVFLLDEVLAYNPNFDVKKHRAMANITVIRNFDGEVKIHPFHHDKKAKVYYMAQIVGAGNVNFRYKDYPKY